MWLVGGRELNVALAWERGVGVNKSDPPPFLTRGRIELYFKDLLHESPLILW